MSVDLDTVVVGQGRYPHDITVQQFERILSDKGSPATPFAIDGYLAIAAQKVSCAFDLACFWKESQFATDPAAVVLRYDTKSPGNCRSTRTGVGTVISTNRGPFVAYPSWTEGWRDMAWRVVDPAYVYVAEQRTTIRRIIERFAPADDSNDPDGYAQTVVTLMNRWIDEGGQQPMAAQIPGFEWLPADRNHYDAGRTTRIRGGAQHYTSGTDSRGWLTTSSVPPVSATFLVKHSPTLNARGWQLVRIEDTAWTTAFANPYTVSIEYEHRSGQSISATAYEVLAQTWVDVTRYVREQNLGDISRVAGHKEWVNNPGLMCPDGIDIGRIQQRWAELLSAAAPPPTDPNARYFPETDRWVVNAPGAPMLTGWDAKGGVAVCGYPLLGMTQDADAVHRQLFENVLLEIWPNGVTRFGGLGQRYLQLIGDS